MSVTSVIHVITTIELGGAEKQLLILAREQIRQGLKIEIVYLKGKPELKSKFEELGVVVNQELANKPIVSQIVILRNIFRNGIALVHAHLPRAEIITAVACRKKEFLITRHNFEPFWPNGPRLVSSLISRFVTRRALGGIAISNAVKQHLLDFREVHNNFDLRVVYYGFDRTKSKSYMLDNNSHKDLTSDTILRLGTIGRLVPGKNYSTIFQATSLLRERYPNVKLFIVGDGLEKKSLIKICNELGIEDNVVWLGRTELIAGFLQEIDLFIFASKGEGFGLVLLEAMLAKKPIFAANNSAIPEVLGANYEGLFHTMDYKMLAKKISEVTENPSLSSVLVSSYSGQLLKFDPILMADKIFEIYSNFTIDQ